MGNIFLANVLQVIEGKVLVELLNIFEEQENVDEHMLGRQLAQKVPDDQLVRSGSPEASSEDSARLMATASCALDDGTEQTQEGGSFDATE